MDFYPLNRKPIEAAAEKRGLENSRLLRIALVAGMLVSGALNESADLNQGKLADYAPQGKLRFPDQKSLEVVTFNVAGRRNLDTQMHYIHDYIKPDFVCLQEVKESSVRRYMRSYPGYWGEYAMADSNVDFPDGFGDLIMSRYKPEEHPNMQQFEGDYDFAQFFKNILERSLGENIRKSYQERRAALAVSFKVPIDGGQTLPVHVINSHLAGDWGAGRQQFKSLKHFVDDESGGKNSFTIVCGDLNRQPNEVRKVFKAPGWYVPDIGPTSVASGNQIDYIITKPEKIKLNNSLIYAIGTTTMLKTVKTDHYAALATFNFIPFNKTLDFLAQ